MAEQNNGGYPTLSEKTWWTIRNRFKASIPAIVSPTYVKSLLSMANDQSANSNVIAPMRRLGLIDDENKPTALANDWRIDEKYSQACEAMLKSVYPQELLDLFPGSDVDRTSARTWFMSQGVGQAAADKMIALFVLLKSKEISDKKSTEGNSKTKATPAKKTAQSSDKRKSLSEEECSKSDKAVKEVPVCNRPNLHIDLQIHISPESTPDQIECIFASMAKHLYGDSSK